MESKVYGPSADVWSVGCIFAEILIRKALLPGKDYLNQLQLIMDCVGYVSFISLSAFLKFQLSHLSPPFPFASLFQTSFSSSFPCRTPTESDLGFCDNRTAFRKILSFAKRPCRLAEVIRHAARQKVHCCMNPPERSLFE